MNCFFTVKLKQYHAAFNTFEKALDQARLQGKLFVCLFVALRPKPTAMVMAGWSVHQTTLFPRQA